MLPFVSSASRTNFDISLSREQIQPGAVITPFHIVRYYTINCRSQGRISIRCSINKRHLIPCANGRAIGCLLLCCGTTRPGRPGVGLSSMLLSRCWASVGPAGVAAWAVTGSWPGAVCELFSPFEHAKYQYLCKNYHYHYYYSWQSLVKALTYLF